MLVGPGALIYGALVVLPLGFALAYAFTDWNGLSSDYNYVGLDNFKTVAEDPDTLQAFKVTAIVTLATAVLVNVIGLGLAVLLRTPGRMTTLYRAILFFPIMLSPIAVGFLWHSLMDYNGPLNEVLGVVGIAPVEFLGKPDNALATLIFVIVWQSLGFTTVIFLAALQTVPRELVEAARVDGARGRKLFVNVTLPMIAPAVTINVVATLIFGWKEYDRVVAVTAGGPAGSTETIAYKIVEDAFTRNMRGLAAAEAFYLLAVIVVLSFATIALLRRNEERIAR